MPETFYVGIEAAFARILTLLASIDARLQQLVEEEQQVMADLSTLTVQVQRNTDVEQSAITLIQGLAGQIAALKTDPVALQALADQLNGSATALAAAVVANTPPPPPPPPV